MKWELKGTVMQFLETEIEPGEVVTSESGKMMYMSDNVDMNTEMKGGLGASIKRSLAGESFFLVEFEAQGESGTLTFSSEFPGKIIPVELDEGEEITAQKDAYLCSIGDVLDMNFTKKIGAGFLGGEGLILVKLEGPGYAFMNVGGEVNKKVLEEGEKLRVDTGSLAAFDSNMDYSVERVKGVKNMIWGGEGLFLATIEGPGRVWIQSMPVKDLAGKIAQYVGGSSGGGDVKDKAAAGAAGAAVGALLGGD